MLNMEAPSREGITITCNSALKISSVLANATYYMAQPLQVLGVGIQKGDGLRAEAHQTMDYYFNNLITLPGLQPFLLTTGHVHPSPLSQHAESCSHPRESEDLFATPSVNPLQHSDHTIQAEKYFTCTLTHFQCDYIGGKRLLT